MIVDRMIRRAVNKAIQKKIKMPNQLSHGREQPIIRNG